VKIRDEAAAKAKADAIKAGKTEAEAEVAGKIAGLEAENAFLSGEVQTGITERQALKTALKDAEPFVARGKAAVEGEKTAETKLAELQAEIVKRDTALAQQGRDTAIRIAAMKAGVDPAAALKLADAAAVQADGSGADEAIAAVVKTYPGLAGEVHTGSMGNDQAGRGNGASIKSADLSALAETDFPAFQRAQAEIKAGKKTVA